MTRLPIQTAKKPPPALVQLATVFCLLSAFDLAATIMHLPAGLIELNPIAAMTLNLGGVISLCAFKMLAVAVCVTAVFIYAPHRPRTAVWVLTGGCAAMLLTILTWIAYSANYVDTLNTAKG